MPPSKPGGQNWRLKRAAQERRTRRTQRRPAEEPAEEGALGPEQPGTVLSNFGPSQLVEDSHGGQHACVARRTLDPMVAGDRVRWCPLPDGTGVIVGLLPRASLLARPDLRGQLKPVAANVDQILIVAAVRPAPSEDLIDRYLVAAELSGIAPLLLINKLDLVDARGRAELQERLGHYGTLGYPVLFVSTRQGDGLDALRAALRGHTSVFVGQSGVGKSSLVNHLIPAVEAAVGDISALGHGRHTTSAARLYRLPEGGSIIDSPGVRDFGLWKVTAQQVATGFPELRPLLGSCRFRDCKHRTEPGCAFRDAAERGRIAPRRLESYHRIVASLNGG